MTDFTIGIDRGVDVIYVTKWTAACRQLIDSGKVSRVVLREGRGWNPSSLEFLREIPCLAGLEVRTFAKFEPIDIIQELDGLEFLALSIPDSPRFNFGALPNLKECVVSYVPGYSSVFSASQIKELYVMELRLDHLPPTSSMTSLRSFTAKSGAVKTLNLDVPSLQTLDLIAIAGFKDFRSVEIPTLERLRCDTCKGLSSFEGLDKCTELRELVVEDCGRIESLKPLDSLFNLETLRIVGDTIIEDGEFACVEPLPKLRKFEIVNHPHYSHRVRFGRLRKR